VIFHSFRHIVQRHIETIDFFRISDKIDRQKIQHRPLTAESTESLSWKGIIPQNL
jgi:hypothetical protein